MNKVSNQRMSIIKKCQEFSFKNLLLCDAQVEDAEFILDIRTDNKKKSYITQNNNSIEHQKKWLEEYCRDQHQAYFIIKDRSFSNYAQH